MKIEKVWLTETAVWIRTDEGKEACELFADYPRLRLFIAHPELNVSALARRMGISQSLMAQYISGKKNASKARMALILNTIHAVGRELAAV